MKPIQLVLFVLLLTVGLVYFSRFRSGLLNKFSILIFGIVSLVLILFPDWTTDMAQLVGVGRGADLLLYLGLLGITFLCLLLYIRLREIEISLTELTRRLAIMNALEPNELDNNKIET